ncbi:hypothetical protein GCM10017044_06590 [Kordiimonas sediminis]|uniref:Uncharacterized protein n=1 Tax=Kordiimonas sediminis TaxID=1735581 RepID=A0A919E5I6_9PROT|nr:hypothetical protein [Kordiimonas sediminis]GHF15129.1 hypothetical protein GCM10017044_06590 [Kordiimonas sediminis]
MPDPSPPQETADLVKLRLRCRVLLLASIVPLAISCFHLFTNSGAWLENGWMHLALASGMILWAIAEIHRITYVLRAGRWFWW